MSFFKNVKSLFSTRKDVSPEAYFTEYVTQIIQELGDVAKVTPNLDEFSLSVTDVDGGTKQLFLTNIFHDTMEMPQDEKRAWLKDRLSIMLFPPQIPSDFEMARSQILPRVIPATFGLPLQDQKPLATQPFLPHLQKILVYDFDFSCSFITNDQLKTWGVEFEDAETAATTNLGSVAFDDIAPYDPELENPIWFVTADDSYESSRLLIPGWLASFKDKVLGQPIAGIPHRGLMLVTGLDDLENVERLLELSDREYDASTRNISPAIYTVDSEEKIIPLELDLNHPLFEKSRRAHIRLAATEYGEQKAHLDKIHEESGVDIFVANFSVVESDRDSRWRTYCVWSEDIDSLLPRTDAIAIAEDKPGDDALFFCKWQDVFEIASNAIVAEPEVYPERFRTTNWPDERTMNKLRERKVEIEMIQ